MDTVPHGLDPLATQDPENDHKRVQEVAEVPPQLASVEVVRDVVGTEQLHAHDGEDEDDDGQNEAEIAQRAHRSTDYADQQVEGGP